MLPYLLIFVSSLFFLVSSSLFLLSFPAWRVCSSFLLLSLLLSCSVSVSLHLSRDGLFLVVSRSFRLVVRSLRLSPCCSLLFLVGLSCFFLVASSSSCPVGLSPILFLVFRGDSLLVSCVLYLPLSSSFLLSLFSSSLFPAFAFFSLSSPFSSFLFLFFPLLFSLSVSFLLLLSPASLSSSCLSFVSSFSPLLLSSSFQKKIKRTKTGRPPELNILLSLSLFLFFPFSSLFSSPVLP